MNYFKHMASILLIISSNNIVAMHFDSDSDSDDEEYYQIEECFGGFGGYKPIEQIMAEDHVSMDSIQRLNLDDELSSLIQNKLSSLENYTDNEIKRIEEYISASKTDCLLAFKALQIYLAAKPKLYDRDKVRSFFDIHKTVIAEFKKTDARIDFVKEINLIIATHDNL